MESITHEISLIEFHQQISFVLNSYVNHGLQISSFNNVIIGGLGGSGIGGRLTRLYFQPYSPVPIEVFSEYGLPGYANEKTLVILCSYSGNTEESLSMFAEAQKRNCTIICVAAGGKLAQLAVDNNLPLYKVEPGYQPRMTLGYGFSTLLMVVGELLEKNPYNELKLISNFLKEKYTEWEFLGKQMFNEFASTIKNKFVVICDLPFEAAAIRFCQQIQENAKSEAFVSVLPESNHNMIESYYQTRETNFILINSRNNERTNLRIAFLKKLLLEKGNTLYEFEVGDSSLNSIFKFIYSTDWLSIYASNALGANNMEVGIIMELKGYLESR